MSRQKLFAPQEMRDDKAASKSEKKTPLASPQAQISTLQRAVGNQIVAQREAEEESSSLAAQASLQSILDHSASVAAQVRSGSAPVIQTKLTLGPVGDTYEQEADAVAKQVVGSISSSGSQPAQRQEEEEVQMKPAIQRQEEEEEVQMKPAVQRQEEEEEVQMKAASTLEGGPLSSDVESVVQSARSGGQSLATPVRSSMEDAFGADFSGVKVHADPQADTLNRSLQARAFTTGQDIFFREGEYNPSSSGGQELLAHELTHVVQQNGPAVQREDEST